MEVRAYLLTTVKSLLRKQPSVCEEWEFLRVYIIFGECLESNYDSLDYWPLVKYLQVYRLHYLSSCMYVCVYVRIYIRMWGGGVNL